MYLATIIGLWLLTHFGDALVENATKLGHHFKVSDVFIGVVVIGLGTSLPEILTALLAALQGTAALGVGNVLGSNIANILLILGLALFLFHKTPLGFNKARLDYGIMVAVTLALLFIAFIWGEVSVWQGGILLAFLTGVLYALMHKGKQHFEEPDTNTAKTPIYNVYIATLIALIGLWLGADFLVRGASAIALSFNIPEEVVGLSLVALGTSLPELAATISSYKARNGGMILGNIIGSNILNILAALGVAGLFTPLSLKGLEANVLLVFGVSIVLLPFFFKPMLANRWVGILFLLSYAGYIAYLYI